MKKNIIISYIEKIKKEDIITYLNKENIIYSMEEIDLIYKAIKNDYETILNDNFMNYISNYKFNINSELYYFIIDKYNQYKKFIE